MTSPNGAKARHNRLFGRARYLQPAYPRFLLIFVPILAVIAIYHFETSPTGRTLLFPVYFLSTWAHELFHCSAGMIVGECHQVEIFPNFGGSAYVTNEQGAWGQAFISAAGLLAPAIMGTVFLVIGINPIWCKGLYYGLIIVLVASLLIVTGKTAIFTVSLIASGLFLLSWLGFLVQFFILHFLAVSWHLGSLLDFDYMFTDTFVRDGQTLNSDTHNIAQALGFGTYYLWGMAIATISVFLLLWSIKRVWLHCRPFKRPSAAQTRYLTRRNPYIR